MNRPEAGRSGPWTGRSGQVSGTWLPVLLWALGAALVSVVIVWLLMPRTPDAFSVAGNALQVGHGNPSAYVYYVGPGSSVGGPNPKPPGPSTPSPAQTSLSPGPSTPTPSPASPSRSTPAPGRSRSPRPIPPPGTQAVTIFAHVQPTISPAALPTALIGSDVVKAAGHSPAVAVVKGPHNAFAVAAVDDTGGRSAIPLLLAAALVTALAWLGGAMFGRRRARWEPQPATGAAALTPRIPPGTEPVTSRELRQLRRDARQRTTLARSLAELVPSMPDALVWQAEKALAEVGVRTVAPDGEPFDPDRHHVVGTEPVPPGGRENTIARTVRPGYADDKDILVYPKVVVYADDTDRRAR